MKTQTLSLRNRMSFYVYRNVSRLYFHMPILFVFFLAQTKSVLAVEILLAMYALSIALCSRLSVGLANILGLKGILFVAELLKAAGLLLLVESGRLTVLAAGQVLGGIGFALGIGTDSALLRTQFRPDQQHEYKKIEATAMAVVFPSVFVAGVIGSMIYAWSQKLPFYLGAAASLLAGASILFFSDRPAVGSADPDPMAVPRPLAANRPDSDLWFWSSYYVVNRSVVIAAFLGLFPFTLTTIPGFEVRLFGALLGTFSICAMLAARYLWLLEARLTPRSLILGLNLLLATSLALLYVVDTVLLALMAIVLLGVAAGAVRPIVLGHINGAGLTASESNRLLSRLESYYGFANAAMLLCIGIAAEAGDIAWAITLFIVTIVVLSLVQQRVAVTEPPGGGGSCTRARDARERARSCVEKTSADLVKEAR